MENKDNEKEDDIINKEETKQMKTKQMKIIEKRRKIRNL